MQSRMTNIARGKKVDPEGIAPEKCHRLA